MDKKWGTIGLTCSSSFPRTNCTIRKNPLGIFLTVASSERKYPITRILSRIHWRARFKHQNIDYRQTILFDSAGYECDHKIGVANGDTGNVHCVNAIYWHTLVQVQS